MTVNRPSQLTPRVVYALALLTPLSLSLADDLDVSRQEFQPREEFASYRQAAWAHFRKKCDETAGEKIYQTVDRVQGILLLKPRKRATEADFRDQYWRGDPYGHDSVLPDTEIRTYLRYLNMHDLPVIHKTTRPGYRFVEVRQGEDVYKRYQLNKEGALKESTVNSPVSRYGVTWDDISTDADRHFWVAGGRMQVIDLRTGSVLAERIGYLIEPGFGSKAGGRRPWLHARLVSSELAACPPFKARGFWPINRLFVERVLKPIAESSHGK